MSTLSIMRLIKLLSLALVAVAALLGGFFVAAIIAAATVAAWLARRFLFKPVETPLTSSTSNRLSRPPTDSNSDVIDISATDVSATSRQP